MAIASSSRQARRRTSGRRPLHRYKPIRLGKRRWVVRALLAGVLAAIVLVGWAVIARRLAPTANTSSDHFDAIVVLGSPADEDGNPTPKELARVSEAVREYERGVARRLLFTGGAERNQYVEADVMASAAAAQGHSPFGNLCGEQGHGHNRERLLCDADHAGARMAFSGDNLQRLSPAAGRHHLQPHPAGLAAARSATAAAGRIGVGNGFGAGNPEDDALPGLRQVDGNLRAVSIPCSPQWSGLRLTLSSDHCPSKVWSCKLCVDASSSKVFIVFGSPCARTVSFGSVCVQPGATVGDNGSAADRQRHVHCGRSAGQCEV